MEAIDFWNRVKANLKRRNRTQEWLCERISVSIGTYRGWITHDRYPDVPYAYLIARELGTTVEFLVSGNETDWKRIHKDFIDGLRDYIASRES